MRTEILARIAVPVVLLFVLIAIRAPGNIRVRPYELGWCVWVFAVLATGVGLGYGWARVRRGR